MDLMQNYIVNNDCYKANINRADSRYVKFQNEGPKGLMLHSVGCAQPSAAVFQRLWNVAGKEVAVHAVIDANYGYVIQCLPWNYRGWHAGGSANNTYIGVEMCESNYIKYSTGGKFTVLDREKAQAHCRTAYNAAVELFAYLCKEHNFSPSTICSHKEGHAKGIASNHGDPEHYWKGLGMSYTMDGFRRDVQKALDKLNQPAPAPTPAPVTTPAPAAPASDLITDIHTAPAWAQPALRELLDGGYINGGTDAETDPDDVNMTLDTIKSILVAKRYVDARIKEIQK